MAASTTNIPTATATARRGASTRRLATPSKAPPTARAAAAPVASKAATRPPADPAWVAPLKIALAALAEAEQRHAHTVARLPVVQQAVTDAKAALSRAEASGVLEYAGRVADEEASARQRLDDAEREAGRTARIAAALAAAVEEHRAVLAQMIETCRVGHDEWTAQQAEAIDAEFKVAMDAAAAIVARFVEFVDRAGAPYLAAVSMRAAFPASLLRAEDVIRVGTLAAMLKPTPSSQSRDAGRLRALLDAARLATAPEADRRVAIERAAQAATAQHERAVNDAAMQAEMAATAAAQRAKIGSGPARDFATAEPLA